MGGPWKESKVANWQSKKTSLSKVQGTCARDRVATPTLTPCFVRDHDLTLTLTPTLTSTRCLGLTLTLTLTRPPRRRRDRP